MKAMSMWVLLMTVASVGLVADSRAQSPTAVIKPAEAYLLPGVFKPDRKTTGYVDCNSPAHWDGDTMYIFSSEGHPYRSSGPDLFNLDRKSQPGVYDNQEGYNGGRWIESTHKADDGKLYGWYHREPGGVCPNKHLTAPQIGAVVSEDNGMHWKDLGIVLKAPDDSITCETPNKYFAGGNGDFSVLADGKKEYLYFLISTYNKDIREQGVSIARMKYEDRDSPVGKVFKWHKDEWKEPGVGGHVTPIFPGVVDWHEPVVDAFWGASIHWNTHLNQFVILLNRAKDKDWAQEGIYVTFNPDLANPKGWTKPVKILKAEELEASKWYPQVIGLDAKAKETDKLSGRKARLFVAGRSKWDIVFLKPGEGAGQ